MSAVLAERDQAAAHLPSSDGNAYRARALSAGRQFLERVDAILPLLRAGRQQSEQQGVVPHASVQAMAEAGAFRAFTPLQYGGLELSPADFFDGIIRMAQADSAAAWIVGQITCHSLEVASMSPRMQDDFWGVFGPDARASSSFAPLGQARAVEGGYVLSGTWTFSSGVDHAQFVVLGGSERNYLVPTTDMTIDHESWDVQGLRGTGSKAITLRDVFVPDYRVHHLIDVTQDRVLGLEVNDRPLYRGVSWFAVFNSTATNTVIGTALEGLRVFMEQSRHRMTKQGTGASILQNPFLHLKLADALTRVHGVRDRHLKNWRELFDKACRGEPVGLVEKMRVRFESADANATCFDAIHDIWPVAGATASASENPLQQVFRDLMAARNHGSGGRELAATNYVRALFDMPPPEFKVIDFAAAAYLR
jgi:3-hydroxy-9,10-secoandrosta-1,3,5(10)-triene-9,17-dione monooxygenase